MTIYHYHHIIPRHMGGTDDPSNLVKVTVEEHAEEHRKLFEQHGRWEDHLAWKALSGQIGKDEIIKVKTAEAGKMHKGMKRSAETRQKMSIAHTGAKRSKETCEAISRAAIGRIISEETKKKISETARAKGQRPPPSGYGEDNPFYGRKHTEETKQKMREAKRRNDEKRQISK